MARQALAERAGGKRVFSRRPRSIARRSAGSVVFDVFLYTFFALFALTIVFPFWNLVLLSFSDSKSATSLGFRIWIPSWHLDSYRFTFEAGDFITAYANTIFRTVLGTLLMLVMCFLGAYPLSKRDLPGRNLITIYFIVPMFFGGGLIPSYLLVRSLGLIDKIWVLIIPGMFSIYSMIIMRNFLMAVDKELEESALIDGANYAQIAVRIIAPVTKPVLATVALWTAVGHWNAWFDAMLYTTSERIVVLQLLIRRILFMNQRELNAMELFNRLQQVQVHSASVTAATILLTIGPIILTYPFLQRYFVKGIMVGSLKG
jgi:putative aldouronate transport system permease protein